MFLLEHNIELFFYLDRFSNFLTKTYQFKIDFMCFKITVETKIFPSYYYY